MKQLKHLLPLLAILFLAGCNLFPTKPATELPVVRYVNFKVYDEVYVGIEKGFFEKHGVKVEIVGDSLAGPTAIQAVASGSAEAGLSSTPALINANAAGLPVQGVADIQSAVPGQPLEHYFVLRDSKIKSVSDLAGSKFAVNLWKSSFHYTALMALDKAHVPADKVEFVLLPFDQQATALVNGSVNVIGLMEPYASAAKAKYGDQIRELFNAHDVFGDKQFCLIFVNRIWAKDHPDQARAFVAGLIDSIEWIETHQDEAKPIIAKYTGIEEQYVPDYHFTPGGIVNGRDIAFWMDYMKKAGDLKVDWLKTDDIGTNAYRPEATPK